MSLIAHYPLSMDTKDYSGNSRDITYNTTEKTNNGKIGGTYRFTDQKHMSASYTFIDSPGCETSFSFWVKASRTDSPSGQAIFRMTDDAIMADYSNSNFRFFIYNSNGTPEVLSFPDTDANIWSHYVCIYTPKELKVYKNGVFVKNLILTNKARESAFRLTLGCRNNQEAPLQGELNDFRIYDHVLSPKEVKEIAKAKILHYKFDDMQEPTTNLVPSPLVFSSGWSPYSNGNDGIIQTDLGTEGIQMINRISWCGVHRSIVLPEPGTYTLSVYTKIHSVTHQSVRPTLYTTGGGLTDVLVEADNTKIGEWQRLQMTQTYTTTNIQLYLICYGGVQQDTHRITAEYTMPQIERKDHATDFVNGSRIGQIKDCSGFKSDSLLLTEQTAPQWTNESKIGKGCYKFNGENKYIEVSPYITKHKQLSFSIWINEHSFSNAYPFFKDNTMLFNLITPTSVRVRCCNGSWATEIEGTTNFRNGWNHYVYTFDNGIQKLYFNGVLLNTVNVNITEIDWNANNLRIGHRYDTDTYPDLNASIDDVRFYVTSLNQQDVQELYSVRTAINKDGTVFCSSISTNSFKPTLVDYSTWNPGSMPNGWRLCGTPAENSMVVYTNPIGEKDIMWATLSNDVGSDADGGFDTTVTGIDNTKKYRVSVWVRRENVGNGRSYLGVGGNTVHRTSDKVLDANPYFVYPSNTAIPNGTERRWLLYIGHIFPAGYTGGMDTESGIWDPVTRTKVLENNTDFYWADNAINTTIRSYLFYSTATQERQYWYRPRIEACDGNQPTLSSLLRCSEHGALLNSAKSNISSSGTINYTNISTVGITDNLIAFYPLKNNKDYSGNKNHMIKFNDLPIPAINNGLTFTGTEIFDIPNILTPIRVNRKSFTISVHFKTSSDLSGYQRLCMGHTSNRLEMALMNNRFSVVIHDGSYRYVTSNITPLVNTEYHIAMTYDSTTSKFRMFIDGKKDGEITTGHFIEADHLAIGNWIVGDQGFKGNIYSVKIFDKDLSEQEMAIEYNTFIKNNVSASKNGVLYASDINQVLI